MSIEEQLFGGVRPREVTGEHEPDSNALREPLPDKDYVVWLHCSGCGSVAPVLRSAVSEITGGPERASYREHYIAADRCDRCLGNGFENARLEPIPE